MPKFLTEFSKRKITPTRSGTPIELEYGEKLNEDGEISIGVVGQIPRYQLIQESRPLDIYQVLKMSGVKDPLELMGDFQFGDEFDDFTSMPRSLAEARSFLIRGERAYMELPLALRDEFGSPAKMLKSLEEGTFKDRCSKHLPNQNSEVIADESKQ